MNNLNYNKLPALDGRCVQAIKNRFTVVFYSTITNNFNFIHINYNMNSELRRFL